MARHIPLFMAMETGPASFSDSLVLR